MLYHEGGKLIVAEEEIAFGELPEPAQQAVSKRFPGGAIELAEKVMRDATVTYEVHLNHGGESVVLVFDPSGKDITPRGMRLPWVVALQEGRGPTLLIWAVNR